MNKKIHRINLQFTPTTYTRLMKLQVSTEAVSQVEVIRRALAVYECILEARQDGAKVIIEKGKLRQELLLIP